MLVSVLLVRWIKCVVGVLLGKVCCWYVVGKFVVGKWVVSKSVLPFPTATGNDAHNKITHLPVLPLFGYKLCINSS